MYFSESYPAFRQTFLQLIQQIQIAIRNISPDMKLVFHARAEMQSPIPKERKFIKWIKALIFLKTVLLQRQCSCPRSIQKRKAREVHSVSQFRFKFRNYLQLLPQIRSLVILWVTKNIADIDNIVTDGIIRKIINMQKEKSRTKNGALGNNSNSRELFKRLPTQNFLNYLSLKKQEGIL